jgi:hypothetical protein
MSQLEIDGALQRLRQDALRPVSEQELDRIELEYRRLMTTMVRHFGYHPADVTREVNEFVRIATAPHHRHLAGI